jgi:hypothetical protein
VSSATVRRGRLAAADFLIIACAVSAVSWAATQPIDDTGTVTLQPTVGMRWQELSPRRRSSTLMEGATQVRVRLNLKPWVGHTGRIYLVLPAQLPGNIEAAWTTTGRLLPGRVQVGGRTQVYVGPITAAVLEDTLTLTLTVDGTQMRQPYNLLFRFEMDED